MVIALRVFKYICDLYELVTSPETRVTLIINKIIISFKIIISLLSNSYY